MTAKGRTRTRNTPLNDSQVARLQEHLCELRNRRNTRYGRLGERVFEKLCAAQGRTVKWLHREGADFLIDGTVRVDVKTRLKLDRTSTATVRGMPASQRIERTAYAIVTLASDLVTVHLQDASGVLKAFGTLTWEQVVELGEWGKHEVSKDGTERERLNSQRVLIAKRIAEEWQQEAKVVWRANRRAQEKMARSGWGAESFYQALGGKKTIDLVVLLYFDQGVIYQVFAYPMGRSSEIEWRSKTVGPNLNGRMTFDPSALPDVFKFASVEEFFNEYPRRFGRLKRIKV